MFSLYTFKILHFSVHQCMCDCVCARERSLRMVYHMNNYSMLVNKKMYIVLKDSSKYRKNAFYD